MKPNESQTIEPQTCETDERRTEYEKDCVQVASEESFPASDPPSWTRVSTTMNSGTVEPRAPATSRPRSIYQQIAREACRGALAGCIATLPMSALMVAMHRQLPRRERYPLPPRIITERAGRPLGVRQLDREERQGLTVVMHFAYGAAMGTAYALMRRSIPAASPATKGTLFGLAVWTGSYLGWLPAMGIHSATEETPRRNGLMIAAHVVFGASLGLLVETFRTSRWMSPARRAPHSHRHEVEQEPVVIGTA